MRPTEQAEMVHLYQRSWQNAEGARVSLDLRHWSTGSIEDFVLVSSWQVDWRAIPVGSQVLQAIRAVARDMGWSAHHNPMDGNIWALATERFVEKHFVSATSKETVKVFGPPAHSAVEIAVGLWVRVFQELLGARELITCDLQNLLDGITEGHWNEPLAAIYATKPGESETSKLAREMADFARKA